MIWEITVTGPSGESHTHKVEITPEREGKAAECRVDGEPLPLDVVASAPGVLSLVLNGRSYEIRTDNGVNGQQIVVGEERYQVEVRDPRSLRSRRRGGDSGQGPRKITAPMPGKVVRVLAPEGTPVKTGQGVVVIEAMKMQNELKSPKDGVVKKISVAEGGTVEAGATLAVVE
jgi:biotin carboxyl carrier protein